MNVESASAVPGPTDPHLSLVPDQMALGSTVRLLREWRGLQVKELAERAGVTSSYVSKVELNQTQLSGRKLAAFANALNVRPDLLTRSIPTQPTEGVHFRSQNKVTQRTRKRAVANMNVASYLLQQMVDVLGDADYPRRLPEYDVDTLDGGPQEAAQLVRQQWRLGAGPIQDLAGVLESAGIVILTLPWDLEGIDALTVRCDGEGAVAVIGLRANVPEDRKRHSLAHELGHLVLDQQSPHPSLKAVEERADAFAGEFLAPYQEIGDDLEGITPSQLDVLHALRVQWGVSIPALVRRAYLAGAINETQYRYWFRVLNARNLVRGQTSSAHPLRAHLAQHLVTSVRGLDYSLADLVDVTALGIHDLQDLLGPAWPYKTVGQPLALVTPPT